MLGLARYENGRNSPHFLLDSAEKIEKEVRRLRIEIFVVKTTKPDFYELQEAKRSLIKLFGGLTVIPKALGYWLNPQTGTIERDLVEIWLVYADLPEPKEEADRIHVESQLNTLMRILSLIKKATHQKSQAYAIDNKIHFI
ncbi:MAG: hypothetical protein DRP00_03390 [Candidatus Aenigmatarchaeota archaeon]|nr:MAG: hypothetical protein DRP00_03390 [Candidatus Aenigmarchaeota archaeon]